MKVNHNISLVGTKVMLVPYRAQHVQKYHEWMSDPELRTLTASEPLTLEEEYEMQRKWQEDEDKLTFIVCARENLDIGDLSPSYTPRYEDQTLMIGDVNLFFKNSPEDGDYEVEVEIMIAENAYRRKGYALEALQMLLSFASSYNYPPSLPVPLERFVIRIGDTNTASVKLFSKLGFSITKHVKVFEELELRMLDSSAKNDWINGRISHYN